MCKTRVDTFYHLQIPSSDLVISTWILLCYPTASGFPCPCPSFSQGPLSRGHSVCLHCVILWMSCAIFSEVRMGCVNSVTFKNTKQDEWTLSVSSLCLYCLRTLNVLMTQPFMPHHHKPQSLGWATLWWNSVPLPRVQLVSLASLLLKFVNVYAVLSWASRFWRLWAHVGLHVCL